MQKLNLKQIGNLKSNRRGSALVGVVVLSILMGIVSVGYLQISATAASNELQQLSDARAFQAAESGLLMGTRWVAKRGLSTWPPSGGGTTIFSGVLINGASVDVKDSVDVNGKVYVVSTATSGKLSYVKRILWLVDSANAGGAGNIINDLTGVTSGLSGIWIDGPAHFNEDIMIAAGGGANVNRFMNGTVTIHSSSTQWINPGVGSPRAGYTNDYSYGVHRKTGSFDTADAGSMFKDRYLSKQDSIVLEYKRTDSLSLPASTQKTTLVFLPGGGVKYTYYSGSWKDTTIAVNSKVLVAPSNVDVQVYGTVNGQLSLATRGTGDIQIVGELKYASEFAPAVPTLRTDGTYDNSTNYGVSMTGPDVLGLFSSRNINVLGKWDSAGINKDFNYTTKANAYIAGMLHAENSMNVDTISSAKSKLPDNTWFLGTRSAKTFNDPFWNRGASFNPTFLYDKRFGTGAVKPAGIETSIHRYGGGNNADSSLSTKQSGWTEQNLTL